MIKTMPMTDASDANLVAESLTGNRDAFGHIVARYQTLICSLAYSGTGNLNQSEDLAQETFLAAWKQLASLREPNKLRSWLCGITRNLTYDSLKKQGREPSHVGEPIEALDASPAAEPLPHDFAISHEEAAILWRSIERIPEIYREPLVLFYREHQSIEAVAQNLELSEDAVKQRLSRGRKLLHEQVLAFVEGALQRTNPGKTLTIAIVAALPMLTYSAKAATLGATAAKGSAAAKSAGLLGVFAAIISPFLIFFGNYLGYRLSLDAAQSDEERARVKGVYKKILWIAASFFAAFAALIIWSCWGVNSNGDLFSFLFCGLVVIYILTTLIFAAATLRRRRKFLREILARENTDLSSASAWEYRTKLELLGLPLVHIRIGDRFAALRKPIKAWIAVGDCAFGGLFAFGGVAIAPFSIGGLAIGLVPFGGMVAGIFALGGLGLGVWAYGGIAVGWQAFGGCAIAWKAAFGGLSFAHDFAIGGAAHAAQANNPIAEQFIRAQFFFRVALVMVRYSILTNLIWVVPLFVQWRLIVRKRRALAAT
jgi:RNA polymerase sigma factor (sigma-70 family)